ncbi:hypothetical protein P7C73_g770, partial [Tremellales sp. Uapishka_1]
MSFAYQHPFFGAGTTSPSPPASDDGSDNSTEYEADDDDLGPLPPSDTAEWSSEWERGEYDSENEETGSAEDEEVDNADVTQEEHEEEGAAEQGREEESWRFEL